MVLQFTLDYALLCLQYTGEIMSKYKYVVVSENGDPIYFRVPADEVQVEVLEGVKQGGVAGEKLDYDPAGFRKNVEGKVEQAVTIASDTFSNALKKHMNFAAKAVGYALEMDESVRPSELTIDFGVNVSGGVTLGIVEGGGEAHIQYSMKWDLT